MGSKCKTLPNVYISGCCVSAYSCNIETIKAILQPICVFKVLRCEYFIQF